MKNVRNEHNFGARRIETYKPFSCPFFQFLRSLFNTVSISINENDEAPSAYRRAISFMYNYNKNNNGPKTDP